MASLCAPDRNLSCFGCCPPIRPEHYDPLDFVGSLRRELAENRAAFQRVPLRMRPIVGYHCWALGFLDAKGTTAGCLLHPARNQGRDLRGLIDYGDKCRRESCVAAREFDLLPPEGQEFWLPLVCGLNPFYYSSRRANPLFHIMPWGAGLLERLREHACRRGWSCTELIHGFPFLVRRPWKPRAHRHLFGLLLEPLGEMEAAGDVMEEMVSRVLGSIAELDAVRHLETSDPGGEEIWTHQGEEPVEFLDFVRLELGVPRTGRSRLQRARKAVELLVREISGFPPRIWS